MSEHSRLGQIEQIDHDLDQIDQIDHDLDHLDQNLMVSDSVHDLNSADPDQESRPRSYADCLASTRRHELDHKYHIIHIISYQVSYFVHIILRTYRECIFPQKSRS